MGEGGAERWHRESQHSWAWGRWCASARRGSLRPVFFLANSTFTANLRSNKMWLIRSRGTRQLAGGLDGVNQSTDLITSLARCGWLQDPVGSELESVGFATRFVLCRLFRFETAPNAMSPCRCLLLAPWRRPFKTPSSDGLSNRECANETAFDCTRSGLEEVERPQDSVRLPNPFVSPPPPPPPPGAFERHSIATCCGDRRDRGHCLSRDLLTR